MPLTLLTGEPLMCILIIAGKRLSAETEMGIDQFKEMVGKHGGIDFLKNNCGKGKLCPGGPMCVVWGIEIPYFVRWNEKGGMSSTILKEVLETLDHLKIFPRVEGLTPVFLVDGHGSRFGIPFLEYINDEDHEWKVCIGIPYNTVL